jgi:malate synthase
MRSYALLLVEDLPPPQRTRDGRHGGADPDQERPAANEAAMAKVRADKEREATDGCDGTWVAHPGLGADREGGLRQAHARAPTSTASSAPTCT